jgi:hypothetical protein
MKTKGREGADWNYRTIGPGWHLVSVQEGIDYLKDDTGARVVNAKGLNSAMIPLAVDDSGDPDNSLRVTIFANNDNFGEQKIADVIEAAGLTADFEKNFPGDVSFFEDRVFAAVQRHLQGRFLKVNIAHSVVKKDGGEKTYANVVNVDKAGAVTASTKPTTPATNGASAQKGW